MFIGNAKLLLLLLLLLVVVVVTLFELGLLSQGPSLIVGLRGEKYLIS